jgi:hypothetical protein
MRCRRHHRQWCSRWWMAAGAWQTWRRCHPGWGCLSGRRCSDAEMTRRPVSRRSCPRFSALFDGRLAAYCEDLAAPYITETKRMHLVLFGMQNRILRSYLAAINSFLVSVMHTFCLPWVGFPVPLLMLGPFRLLCPVGMHLRSQAPPIGRPNRVQTLYCEVQIGPAACC